MAKAKYLADVDNNKIYPVGHTRAVYDENGTLLEDRLTSDEQKIATEATERKNADNTKVNISGGDVSKTVVSFTQSSTRTDITSGDTVSTLFGKIKKWFADLKTVAWAGNYSDLTGKPSLFSGSYNDLSNKPTSFTPSSHASTDATYGAASSSNYGHTRLSDSVSSTSSTSSGYAATPYAVKQAYDTGLVTYVDGDYFETVEGNTSGASGIIANGGECALRDIITLPCSGLSLFALITKRLLHRTSLFIMHRCFMTNWSPPR